MQQGLMGVVTNPRSAGLVKDCGNYLTSPFGQTFHRFRWNFNLFSSFKGIRW